MKKATRSEEQGSPRKANITTRRPALSPREARLLVALVKAQDGLSRSAVDKVTPASNGPHYVEQLRLKLGLQIPCKRVDFVTIDGIPSWYGHYSLTDSDRKKLTRAR